MNSLFFEEISEQEVINLCSSLPSGTATGFDNVTMSLIKETIASISSLLTRIFNLSITSRIVPEELKISRVVPLFKAGHCISAYSLSLSCLLHISMVIDLSF